jgi:hypothetical protein
MTHNHPANRQYLLATAAKLFCPICKAIREVTDFFSGVETAQLDCGHRRLIELKGQR